MRNFELTIITLIVLQVSLFVSKVSHILKSRVAGIEHTKVIFDRQLM